MLGSLKMVLVAIKPSSMSITLSPDEKYSVGTPIYLHTQGQIVYYNSLGKETISIAQ